MNGITLLIVGLAVSINILVIKVKLEKKRFADAGMDATILIALTIVFGGSFNGLITATVASSVVSVYLWFSPPKFGSTKAKTEPSVKKKAGNAAVNDFRNSFEMIVDEYKGKQ